MTIKLSPEANAIGSSQSIGLVFACAYVGQGISQHFCLIAQPLNNFFRSSLHMDPAGAAFCISLLMIPWVIKPIYGLVSDKWRFARPGQNRLRFLVMAHVLAGLSYLWLAACLFCLGQAMPPSVVFVVVALVALAGICIAFATVVFVAMTVDTEESGASPRIYFGQQALSYSLANIGAVACGGALCAHLAAPQALAWGVTIAALILFLLPLVFVRYLGREKSGAERLAPQDGLSLPARLKALTRSRAFLATLLFLTLWNLSPSLGVSLYYFECDKLRFTQGQIGMLAACTSSCTLVGAIVFRCWLAKFFHGGRSTYALVALGAVSNLSYVLLSSPESGMVIEFFRGFATFVATLAIYGLAADVSPRGLTATAMAVQIAVFNLASEGSIALGGYLYGRVFGKELLPLIVVSSVTTLLTAFLVPFLGRKRL